MRPAWAMLAAGAMGVAAACALPCSALAAITVRLETAKSFVAPGDTVAIDVVIPVADSTFNAFHLVVGYDPAHVAFVPTTPVSGQVGSVMSDACPNLFHQFNAYVDSTVADLSLLCSETFVTGPGVIYRLTFRALSTPATAPFTIGVSSHCYHAGPVVTPLYAQGLTLAIVNVADAPPPRRPEWGFRLEAPRPNPLHSGEGATVAFTLPTRASVALELFDLLGRRVAAHAAGDTPAGPSALRWALPPIPAGHYQLRLRVDGQIVARTTWVVLH